MRIEVRRITVRRLALAGFLLVLALAPLAPAFAGKNPNYYHWAREKSHFTLDFGKNLDGTWKRYLRRSVNEWNENGTVTLEKVKGNTNGKSCRRTEGMVEVCNAKYGQHADGIAWIGITQIKQDKDRHLKWATIRMNDSFFNDPDYNYDNEESRRHTMCHEIGHALGLSIIDPPQSHPNTKSCMNNSQHAVRHYVDPIKSDFRDLESIYKHKDPYTTLGRSASDSARSDGTDFFDPTSLPSVPSGLDGRETVTIQTLDDGGQIVTFITWVEKEP